MTYDYDVIVVGARVAGSSTAMLVSRFGHRVLLVDRVRMPTDTVSTHAILRSGVLQLMRWGVLDRIVDAGTPAVHDVTLGFAAERIPVTLSNEYGVEALYAPRRHLIDFALAEAAVEDGAEFRDGTRLKALVHDVDGRVIGADLDGQTVTARYVVGADGVFSKVADLVDAKTYRSHDPTNAVHYSYFTGIEHPGFWFQFTPGVNAGLIQTNDATLVFVGRPTSRFPAFQRDPESEFHRLLGEAGDDLAAEVARGTRIERFHGTRGLPGHFRRPSGPGWVLVGDAGYTKDPISAHGMSDALRDAELCAGAIDRALRDPGVEAEAFDEYHQTRDTLSMRMFRESQALAAYGWDAAEASRRMRAISASVDEECEVMLTREGTSAVAT